MHCPIPVYIKQANIPNGHSNFRISHVSLFTFPHSPPSQVALSISFVIGFFCFASFLSFFFYSLFVVEFFLLTSIPNPTGLYLLFIPYGHYYCYSIGQTQYARALLAYDQRGVLLPGE